MKNLVSKIWFPIVLTGLAAVQSFGIDAGRYGYMMHRQDRAALAEEADSIHTADSAVPAASGPAAGADTLQIQDSTDIGDTVRVQAADSLQAPDSTGSRDSIPAETVQPRDTIVVPDSLRYTDSLKFKYYIALKDSLTRAEVRDSLRAAGDSLELHRLDSLVYKDSTETVARDSIARFNALSKRDKTCRAGQHHACQGQHKGSEGQYNREHPAYPQHIRPAGLHAVQEDSDVEP